MASIQKRGDFTYRLTVSNGYDRNGKKIMKQKTVTLDSSLTQKQIDKEMERLAVLFEDEVKKGNYIDPTITFETFTRRWLSEYAEKQLERKTIASYKAELDTKILPAIGHIKLNQLQPLQLTKYYEMLTEDGIRLDGKPGGYSTRTIKYSHQIISSILQTAVYWQVIPANICRNVKPPKGVPPKKKDNYFDDTQAKAFIEYTASAPLKYQALVLITIFGGLRLEEVLPLKWADIDFKNRQINRPVLKP